MANVPRLCGGTFFLQVLRMKKPMSRKPSKALEGEKDRVNNQRVLEALIQLFDPKFMVYADSTFKGDTSDYRACKEAAEDFLFAFGVVYGTPYHVVGLKVAVSERE